MKKSSKKLKNIDRKYLSAFSKKCWKCGDYYYDYLENKFHCDACERNDKIDKILKD